MMLQHRYEQALALAERSVALHEAHGSGHGLAVALATLGQICVRLGDLGARRRRAAPRARRPQPDSVPRNHRRGVRHAGADSPDSRPLRHGQRLPRRAPAKPTAPTAGRRATGTSGRCASSARASRCAAARSTRRSRASTRFCQAGAPAVRRAAGDADCRRGADRRRPLDEAEQRLPVAADALDPKVAPAAWGEYLRLRGALHAQDRQRRRRLSRLLAERGAARSARRALPGGAQPSRARPARRRNRRALGRRAPPRSGARRSFSSSAPSAISTTRAPRRRCSTTVGTGQYVISPADADDAIVRRIVDAAALPDLLGRETAAALHRSGVGRLRGGLHPARRRRRARDRCRGLRRGCRARAGASARATARRTAEARSWSNRSAATPTDCGSRWSRRRGRSAIR